MSHEGIDIGHIHFDHSARGANNTSRERYAFVRALLPRDLGIELVNKSFVQALKHSLRNQHHKPRPVDDDYYEEFINLRDDQLRLTTKCLMRGTHPYFHAIAARIRAVHPWLNDIFDELSQGS